MLTQSANHYLHFFLMCDNQSFDYKCKKYFAKRDKKNLAPQERLKIRHYDGGLHLTLSLVTSGKGFIHFLCTYTGVLTMVHGGIPQFRGKLTRKLL